MKDRFLSSGVRKWLRRVSTGMGDGRRGRDINGKYSCCHNNNFQSKVQRRETKGIPYFLPPISVSVSAAQPRLGLPSWHRAIQKLFGQGLQSHNRRNWFSFITLFLKDVIFSVTRNQWHFVTSLSRKRKIRNERSKITSSEKTCTPVLYMVNISLMRMFIVLQQFFITEIFQIYKLYIFCLI